MAHHHTYPTGQEYRVRPPPEFPRQPTVPTHQSTAEVPGLAARFGRTETRLREIVASAGV